MHQFNYEKFKNHEITKIIEVPYFGGRIVTPTFREPSSRQIKCGTIISPVVYKINLTIVFLQSDFGYHGPITDYFFHRWAINVQHWRLRKIVVPEE